MIRKILFILSISMGYYSIANAQALTKEELDHSDIYFLKKSGESVTVKDSADYIRVISAPDTEVRNAYVVRDFYLNGKPKMTGRTLTPTVNLKRQGIFVEYFPNGRRKTIENYENGDLAGEATHYYPNGKLYYISAYDKDKKLNIVSEARDSTGKVTAEAGKGTWTVFDDDFKIVTGQGPIDRGLKEGGWSGIFSDSIKYVCMFKDGKGASGISYLPSGKINQFSEVEVEPSFKGGMSDFYKYLAMNIHYPATAKENNIQGKVFLTFTIESDGKLDKIKVLRGIGSGCDEEAMRVISASPRWNPGYLYGIPVNVKYQVPIGFFLQQETVR